MNLDSKKAIVINFEDIILGHCYGGRFMEYSPKERRLAGVKMAAEINHQHEVSIPTEDFSIPSDKDMNIGMIKALEMVAMGNDLYAGCMGGIGRTGLFMGILCKTLIDYHQGTYMGYTDPVTMVRAIYKAHAIETKQQQDYVRGFDTTMIREAVEAMVSPVGVLTRAGYETSNKEPEIEVIEAPAPTIREGFAYFAKAVRAFFSK